MVSLADLTDQTTIPSRRKGGELPHFILSGRKGVLPRVTVLRRAENANLALIAFRAEGFQEIVLHTDDAMAASLDPSVFENGTTPNQWIQFTKTPNTYSARFQRYLLNISPWWPLHAIGLIISYFVVQNAWQNGQPLHRLPLLGLAIPALLAATATLFSRPVQLYGKLNEALAWHRPDDVMKYVAQLRRSSAASGLPPYELTFREAHALAMQGRLEEALDLAETVRALAPEWLFWNAISEIYASARRGAERLATMEQCVRLQPDNPTCLLDLAMTLVRVNGDMVRAKEVLECAKTQALAEPIQPFVQLAEGMIAVQEGRGATAIPLLEFALEKNTAVGRVNPLAEQINDRTRAYLALAYAQAGNHAQAEKYFRQAERRLQLVPSFWDLRDRCYKELRCVPADEFS